MFTKLKNLSVYAMETTVVPNNIPKTNMCSHKHKYQELFFLYMEWKMAVSYKRY